MGGRTPPNGCGLGLRPYYQQAIFDDRSSGIQILHWSRQIGKSFTLAAWAVDRLLSRPGRLVTVLSIHGRTVRSLCGQMRGGVSSERDGV